MGIWEDEMKSVNKLKKLIYKSPLPKKKQQITARAQLPGKVRMFTESEIFLSNVRRYRQSFV